MISLEKKKIINIFKNITKEKMINIITISIAVLIISTQSINAEEKNNKLSQKFNHFWNCINKEIDKTKDFQIKQWNEGKNKTRKTLIVGKHKLTGFFSDFPELDKK